MTDQGIGRGLSDRDTAPVRTMVVIDGAVADRERGRAIPKHASSPSVGRIAGDGGMHQRQRGVIFHIDTSTIAIRGVRNNPAVADQYIRLGLRDRDTAPPFSMVGTDGAIADHR